jgi:DNA-directed RNA polymerase subunit M/transcription elongation factor TFIIS
MDCPKCSAGHMYVDTDRQAQIETYACLKCGNRIYVGYPRRRGIKGQARWEAEVFVETIRRQLPGPPERAVEGAS